MRNVTYSIYFIDLITNLLGYIYIYIYLLRYIFNKDKIFIFWKR